MKKTIKLFDPTIGNGEDHAVKKVLSSKFWASGSGIGQVFEFETKFNDYIGSDRCIALNSGTAALHLALSLFDIKNKELILPSLSFVATAHAVVYNGGIPVFVDVEPNTLCIDPDMIKKAITKKTKLVLPVHYGGLPSNLLEIIRLCKEHDLILVEDAAHAAGATYNEKRIGNHGEAVCFSFHPVKNLAMPTGGAITLNLKDHKKLESILKSRRWCGISDRTEAKYNVTDIGWNYYMNEFSAAIGIEQLKKLDANNIKRKKIARYYSDKIELEAKMPFNKDCSYHLYWIRVKNRDKFRKMMAEKRIETGIHYLPIHKMKYYNKKYRLPITEAVGESVVTIPIHANLSFDDVKYITRVINTLI